MEFCPGLLCHRRHSRATSEISLTAQPPQLYSAARGRRRPPPRSRAAIPAEASACVVRTPRKKTVIEVWLEVRTTTTSKIRSRPTIDGPSSMAKQKYFRLSPPPADTHSACPRILTTAAAPLEQTAAAARRSRGLRVGGWRFGPSTITSVLGHALCEGSFRGGAKRRGRSCICS